jgi:hypothetical protein
MVNSKVLRDFLPVWRCKVWALDKSKQQNLKCVCKQLRRTSIICSYLILMEGTSTSVQITVWGTRTSRNSTYYSTPESLYALEFGVDHTWILLFAEIPSVLRRQKYKVWPKFYHTIRLHSKHRCTLQF